MLRRDAKGSLNCVCEIRMYTVEGVEPEGDGCSRVSGELTEKHRTLSRVFLCILGSISKMGLKVIASEL